LATPPCSAAWKKRVFGDRPGRSKRLKVQPRPSTPPPPPPPFTSGSLGPRPRSAVSAPLIFSKWCLRNSGPPAAFLGKALQPVSGARLGALFPARLAVFCGATPGLQRHSPPAWHLSLTLPPLPRSLLLPRTHRRKKSLRSSCNVLGRFPPYHPPSFRFPRFAALLTRFLPVRPLLLALRGTCSRTTPPLLSLSRRFPGRSSQKPGRSILNLCEENSFFSTVFFHSFPPAWRLLFPPRGR